MARDSCAGPRRVHLGDPPTGGMRVPGRIYADVARSWTPCGSDQSLGQVRNVAHLPGIAGYSLAMPDIHFGYGFPIGGVAAFGVDDGVVSPGGVGYDINCGVRLLATDLSRERCRGDSSKRLVDQIFRDVPSGVGSHGAIQKLDRKRTRAAWWCEGAAWAVEQGTAPRADLEHTEAAGALPGADPDARQRPRLRPRPATRWAPSARATTSSRSRWSTRSSTRGRRAAFGLCRGARSP